MYMNVYIKMGLLWILKHFNILLDAQISTEPGLETLCALRNIGLSALLAASPKLLILKGSQPSLLHHHLTMVIPNTDTDAGFQALAELGGFDWDLGNSSFK